MGFFPVRRVLLHITCLTLGAVLSYGAARAADLSVCIDQASPDEARDQHIAEAVAAREAATLSVYHFDGNAGDNDVGLRPRFFKTLVASHCQLVLGYPLDMTNGSPPSDLTATIPYDQAGFVLVVPKPGVARGLADLPRGSDVAVTYLTAPNLYFVDHPNVQADIEQTDADTLQMLLTGKVKAAMIWQATLVHFLGGHPNAHLSYRLLHEPHARWNIVALYGVGGTAAGADFNRAIAALKPVGEQQHQAPARPRHHAGNALIHNAVWQIAIPVADTVAAPQGGGGGMAAPALYTQSQADDGMAQFSANCAQCHGDHLEGRSGPSLTGKNFANAKADFTVSDVFHIVSQNMPATQPGSLAHDDYVQIMAFLLQQNGYPAGPTALTFDAANNSQTPLRYHGP